MAKKLILHAIIEPLSDIPVFYIKYLTTYKVHMHVGAIRNLFYCCAHVRDIIHSVKPIDHLPVHRHKPYKHLYHESMTLPPAVH